MKKIAISATTLGQGTPVASFRQRCVAATAPMLARLVAVLALALGLAACTDDGEPRLDNIIARCDNPPVRLYIEQFDGENIVGGEWLSVTPNAPFHAPEDPPTVYTLDPLTVVSVGEAQIPVQRYFDYDLQHYSTDRGRTADVAYKPLETRVCNTRIDGDSAHIIVESGMPYLLVERDTFALELRFSQSANPLPPADVPLQTEFFYSGRTIVQPHPTTTCGLRTDADGTYFYVRTTLRLPYLYDSNGQIDPTFSYTFGFSSPELFGDDYMHYADVVCYGNDWGLEVIRCEVDGRDMGSRFDGRKPYSIVIHWNKDEN